MRSSTNFVLNVLNDLDQLISFGCDLFDILISHVIEVKKSPYSSIWCFLHMVRYLGYCLCTLKPLFVTFHM